MPSGHSSGRTSQAYWSCSDDSWFSISISPWAPVRLSLPGMAEKFLLRDFDGWYGVKSNSSRCPLIAVVSVRAAEKSICRCLPLWFWLVAILFDNIGVHNECVGQASSGGNAGTKGQWNTTRLSRSAAVQACSLKRNCCLQRISNFTWVPRYRYAP